MSAIMQLQTKGEVTADLRLMSAAMEACPESLAVVENGRVLYANRAFAQMFGYFHSEVLCGRLLSEFVPEERFCVRSDEEGKNQGQTLGCGYPGCEFTGTRKDGGKIQVQAACAGFQIAGRSFLVISTRDLSYAERRRLVRDSERRFRAMFDAAAIGIIQYATDGHIVESNPAVESMLGYSHSELRGMHFRDFTHPDDFASEMGIFQGMVAGKRDNSHLEVRYHRKDRAMGWARFTMSLVRGPDEKPEFVMGMAEDITEQKRTEQQLRESQKMEAIGRLVGGVAHDFNNLLTGIMLYCDLLLAGLEGGRLRHHAEEIRMAGEHGAALIQQLLAVARQQVVEPQILSWNEIISGTRNLLARLIGENIEMVTVLADDLACVKMDPAQAQQVILNLVLNARDAMPNGGRVVLETRNGRDFLPHPSDQKPCLIPCVEFTVTDAGSGMDAETRSRLFEPFFTTKSPGQGNGLGLATVYSIVKQDGGAIDVQSAPGKGTRVIVRLPQVQEAAKELPPLLLTAPVRKEQETILLVEDNLAVRKSMRRILAECGYRVLEAAGGAAALKLCQRHKTPIDLLLVDLVMPGMSGREVARQLRGAQPGLRVLFVSGYDQQRTGEASGEPMVLFRKPFTGRALVQKVREVLGESPRARSECQEKVTQS